MNIILDGSNLLHRAHWINQARKQDSINDDMYIFLNSLRSYARMFNTKNIYCAWDAKLVYPSTNFRHKLTEGEYKGQRDQDKSKHVWDCTQKLYDVLTSLGIKNMFPRIMEADDVISWLSKNLKGPNVIITVDKDMLQLINESNCVFEPRTKTLIDTKNFTQEVGIEREYFVAYKAINGDTADNLPGIKGYGEVKSKTLAKDYVNGLIQDKSMIKLIEENIKLMDLSVGYEIAGPEESNSYGTQFNSMLNLAPDLVKFKQYCEEYKFNSFIKGFDQWKDIFKQSRLLDLLGH